MDLRIHVPSALVGAGVLGLIMIATGAQHVLTDPSPKTLKWPVEEAITIRGIPGPEDHIAVLDEGIIPAEGSLTAFAVPSGKWLVITHGWVNKTDSELRKLWEGSDGMAITVKASLATSGFNGADQNLGSGVSFAPGSEVLFSNPASQPQSLGFGLVGYLLDA